MKKLKKKTLEKVEKKVEKNLDKVEKCWKKLKKVEEEMKKLDIFGQFMSCLLVTLITCLKGHKSLRVLYGSVFQKCVGVSELVSDEATYRAVPLFSEGQLKIYTAQKHP